ncbi:Mov34/MPN/PAD-1 family protein [Methylobacterium sp. 275MFSha3.1]|uniref:Mov34/MPN/PAD-1 family protein n=1 Tax=Methylobacterium sp. 275MFSha3.1 TaxID=1502746 RepID=UPI00147CD720|nr:Mov34/MPN/PAD-1 family protein [Methylobacterium sp. 275MFSha3.1]
MILQTRSEGLILLRPGIERTIATYVAENEIGLEAGGIFIGSYRGPHIEIGSCTTPLPRDVRKPTLFDRSDPGHHAAALEAWKESSGTDTYVGEWHTHPVDDPVPSDLDLRTWRTIMRRVSDPLIFLIAGRRSIWCGRGRGGELAALTVIDAA